jgi:zinc/manganese transport system permease protein
VIFVDLSLAQIASLGAAIGVWQGFDPHEPAILLDESWRSRSSRPHLRGHQGHEANIRKRRLSGFSYAVASAAVIVAMSKATGEAEHLKDMLVGKYSVGGSGQRSG